MDDLTAFVRARLDEDEAAAWSVHDVAKCDAILYEDLPDVAPRDVRCDCGYPARVRREVAAKRAILAQWEHSPAGSPVLTNTLYQLAAIWSGHPDCRPEWALSI